MRERDIERYLVKRVKELGGEVRKVEWPGRKSAPDRLVMLPWNQQKFIDGAWSGTVWVELKAPGLAATFPSNAHERAQHREHERMRKCGQTVLVIDNTAHIDEVLR